MWDAVGAIVTFLVLAIVAGVGYVIIHFVHKYW